MESLTLEAKPRAAGKQSSRATRREGNVPCVLYGHNVEAVSFALPISEVRQMVRTTETKIFKIQVEKDSWDCILKNVDFHPVTDNPIHADFQVLLPGEKINLSVPIHFEGIATAVGVRQGGNAQRVISIVDITCLPKDIPPYLSVDVSEVEIGQSIRVRDLETENIEFRTSLNQTIFTVLVPRVIIEEEEEEEGEEGIEGEEGAEGEGGGEAAAEAPAAE